MTDESRSLRKESPGFVISAGTQVVLQVTKQVDENQFRKPGSVGIVAQCPRRADGEYLIEFTDGSVVRANFDQLSLRRLEVSTMLSQPECEPAELMQYLVYKCQVGSKAFGLSHAESDDDIRGVYLPPAQMHWSLYALPEQLENVEGDDEVFWEFEKYVRLLLKANPNVLETLWSPLVLEMQPMGEALRASRKAFLSRHLYKTYSGYVLSQFRRMKNQVEHAGTFKPKHAMHLIRLLYSGIHALRAEEILIDVGKHREELLAIRHGEWDFERIRQHALKLDIEFQQAFEGTNLPEQPDYQCVNALLIAARQSRV